MQPKLKVLELFAGIGGFSLGLERTGGFETVAFCEIKPANQSRLRMHFPNVSIAGDICKLSYDRKTNELIYDGEIIYVGTVDVITGGFPCQPFSFAGKRKGTEDDRHLWPEMLRLIDEVNPTWVIGENVAGLTTMVQSSKAIGVESRTGGRTADGIDYEAVYLRQEELLLNRICEDLEEVNFEVQPFVIPAVAVDAKHLRNRIFIVAHSNGIRQSQQGETGNKPRKWIVNSCQKSGTMANPVSQGLEGYAWNVANQNKSGRIGKGSDRSTCLPRLLQRTDAPRRWQPEPDVGRVAHGIPDRLDRIEALGNAIIPAVLEDIGAAVLTVEASKQDALINK